jgi:hypothetical protein
MKNNICMGTGFQEGQHITPLSMARSVHISIRRPMGESALK